MPNIPAMTARNAVSMIVAAAGGGQDPGAMDRVLAAAAAGATSNGPRAAAPADRDATVIARQARARPVENSAAMIAVATVVAMTAAKPRSPCPN